MKIELEVSEKNEGTESPYWLILDPSQNMDCSVNYMASQITGPFFSREEAESLLQRASYNFTSRAVIYCCSGCYSKQYMDAYRKAEKEVK